MNTDYECVVSIVNSGFADEVMDCARAAGATGGTIIKAHGTAPKNAELFFDFPVSDEKEMLLILVPSEIKDNVLHALYQNVGMTTAGHGIAFSLPVDNVVGLKKKDKQ